MNTYEIKKQLHDYIELADDRMAGALLAMFQNYFQIEGENKKVLYTIKGRALDKADLIKEVMDAVEDGKKGNYLTTEELRKQFKARKNGNSSSL